MLADMVNGMSMLVDMLSWMLIPSINVNAIFNANLCFDKTNAPFKLWCQNINQCSLDRLLAVCQDACCFMAAPSTACHPACLTALPNALLLL